MYDGFDEDSQIFSRFSGLVPFEADPKARWAGVIEGHLKHKLLLPILRNNTRHTEHVIPLYATKSNEGRISKTVMMKGKGWKWGEDKEAES